MKSLLFKLTMFIVGAYLSFGACGLLGPEDKEKDPVAELEPGSRNYTWTVDSVYSAPGGWMNTIWGSSPDNVWIASSGGFEKLWHYNGSEWTPYPYREGLNGFTGDFYSIFGFEEDNVWMGGQGPGGRSIWHYDGRDWKLFYTYKPNGKGEATILDIWGCTSSNLHAVGTVPTGQSNPTYQGFILHYDGRQWREELMTDFGMQFQRIRENEEQIYLSGSGPYSTQLISDSVSIYKLNDNHLDTMYSKNRNEAGSVSLNKFGGKVYFVAENEVLDTSFISNLPFTLTEDVYGVDGRHGKDMFITTEKGVSHFNGENVEYLLALESRNAVVFRTFIMEKDVFFLVNDYDAGTNVIYHGTLNEEEEEE
ncbi:MAG: hypothetical protein NXI08_03500 [bacterium]|nr:hypothetical protein [bacterium]